LHYTFPAKEQLLTVVRRQSRRLRGLPGSQRPRRPRARPPRRAGQLLGAAGRQTTPSRALMRYELFIYGLRTPGQENKASR